VEHPVSHPQNSHALKVVDHFKSGETFSLKPHPRHGFLMTEPAPLQSDLPFYYDSEEYISHTDSNKGLLASCYQWAKKIALKRKAKLIDSFMPKKGKLLDVGAGTGDFLKFMTAQDWQVSGTEPNGDARKLAAQKNLDLAASLDELPDSKFRVITLWHVLEHIPNLETTLDRLKELLEEDGILIVAVPNHRSLDAQYYGPFWAAYDVPRHLWHFDKDSMKSLMQSRFELKKIEPMKFDSYYVSLLSEKYKGSSLGMFKASYRGWLSNLKAKKSGEYSSLIYIFGQK